MLSNAKQLEDLRIPPANHLENRKEIEKGKKEKTITLPTLGEILKEEFMEPYDISQYKLAKDTGMPVSRIQDIIHGRRKVTPDTSLRLGTYFGVSEKYFLNIQNDLDLRELKRLEKEFLDKIVPISLALL